MKMPASVSRWLLFNLHTLRGNSASPDFFPGGVNDAAYPARTPSEQQLAVDMIYRCLKCGLIDIDPEGWRQAYGVDDIEGFAERLAQVDQFGGRRLDEAAHNKRMDDMMSWLGPELYCTEAGEALVSRYFPRALDLEDERNVAGFNEEICELFEANGVPWTNEALIPLRF